MSMLFFIRCFIIILKNLWDIILIGEWDQACTRKKTLYELKEIESKFDAHFWEW